jgi:hypothetical protein
MRNPDIPGRERLPLRETVASTGWSLAKTAGKVVLATVEGAIDGAVNSAIGQVELCRMESDDKLYGLHQLEEHANDPESHKSL